MFSCLFFPRLQTSHKLLPRSTPCIFLGYPTYHRGFCYFDLSTKKIIISRHVVFNETVFPYGLVTPTKPPSYDFLSDPDMSPALRHVLHPNHLVSATPSHNVEDSNIPTPPSFTHPHEDPSPSSQTLSPSSSLHTSSISSVPRSHMQALKDRNWRKAMLEEYNALTTNGTWVLVPYPKEENIVRSMWLF